MNNETIYVYWVIALKSLTGERGKRRQKHYCYEPLKVGDVFYYGAANKFYEVLEYIGTM